MATAHGLWLERGLCYIQILLVEGQKIGHASLGQAHMAASAIISRCVANENSQGGIAYNIGNGLHPFYNHTLVHIVSG